jgi:flagellar basal-body rod modification protein FlgD
MTVSTTTTSALTGTSGTSNTTNSSASSTSSSQQLAGNFNTFLQLLTTQLQNQDPLNPLDTDQFTQQLVEFSSVEQQINTNSNLQTLISLQQASEATSALQLIGSTVTVGGSTAPLSNATNTPATWSLTSSGAGTGQVTITSASGQTVYTGTVSLSAGAQSYSWNGQGNNGTTYADGNYTLAINATSASGQALTVTPGVQGTITAVNATQSPPTITMGGQNYPMSSIQSVSSSSPTSSIGSSLSSSISSLNSSISSLNSSISTLSTYL